MDRSETVTFRAVSVAKAAGRRSIVFTAVPSAQVLISLMQVVILRMQTLEMPQNLSNERIEKQVNQPWF
jgi:hypothetical protein